MKPIYRTAVRTLTVLVLAACAAACAATRTQQAAGEYVDDAALTAQVKTALAGSSQVKAYQVDVETFRGVVQLNGYVDSASARQAATGVAKSVEGVREVRNNLVVAQEPEAIGEAVDDSMVTARVKAALIDNPETKAGQINVTTEGGVVQLSGFVDSTAEKAEADRVARTIAGVRDVRNELDIKQAP